MDNTEKTACPVCYKLFPIDQIEVHANKCIFLNFSDEPKQSRKRTPSPTAATKQKSPRLSLSSSNLRQPRLTVVSLPDSNEKPNQQPQTQTNASSPANVPNQAPSTSREQKKDLNFFTPLAKQVAPTSLDEFFGQDHIMGRGTVLRTLLEKGEVPNMILWGPPGSGKTSLAGVVRAMCRNEPKKYRFMSLCAANCGVKDVQAVVSTAKLEQKFGRRTVLFMDEVHRFNKKQQDIFLMHVERGDITLIGATTENPSFSINSPLLSRCRVIVLKKLLTDELLSILERAVNMLELKIGGGEDGDATDSYSETDGVVIEKSALEWLADVSDGDARIALSNLELVLQHNDQNTNKVITVEDIKSGIKKSHMLYDRKGEEHYNIISAMHKSIRQSDVNASLYWTTRMIVSGEDPMFIARRMVRAASEDIGNADPKALQLAVATMQGCHLLGMPEADCLLAQCAIYLARAPKSREADSALAAAKGLINDCRGVQASVPLQLRNAPTNLMKNLGYGKRDITTKQSCMPDGLEDINFFK